MNTNYRKKTNNNSNNEGSENKKKKSPMVDYPASKNDDPLSKFRLGKHSKPKHKSKPVK
ncbi:MAG: hypothetical protein SNJ70_01730 [Armatimonadota bacterium]